MELGRREDREPEWLDAAPPPLTPAQRLLRRRILGSVAVVMVGLLSTSLLVQRQEHEASTPPTPTTPTAGISPTPHPRIPPATTSSPGAAPVILRRSSEVGDEAVDFDLFALSASSVYRIEAGSGRVTRTAIELGTDAQHASFLAVPGAVIVRPGDAVPGVLVPDGRPAQPLRGLLREASYVLPGPDGHLWSGSYDRENRVMLSDLRGSAVGPISPSPVGWAVSDQRGNLLVTDVGGTYESRPSGMRRVTTGQVTATGPNHYVVVECDEEHACSSLVLDRKTGERRRLGAADTASLATGSVSPDGRYAALSRWTSDGVLLRDLRTGRTRRLPVSVDVSFDGTDGVAVWSPDSRRLFLVADGRLAVYDTATSRVTQPDLGLTGVVVIALRPQD